MHFDEILKFLSFKKLLAKSLRDWNVKHDTAAKMINEGILRAFVLVLNCYLLVTGVNDERSQL